MSECRRRPPAPVPRPGPGREHAALAWRLRTDEELLYPLALVDADRYQRAVRWCGAAARRLAQTCASLDELLAAGRTCAAGSPMPRGPGGVAVAGLDPDLVVEARVGPAAPRRLIAEQAGPVRRRALERARAAGQAWVVLEEPAIRPAGPGGPYRGGWRRTSRPAASLVRRSRRPRRRERRSSRSRCSGPALGIHGSERVPGSTTIAWTRRSPRRAPLGGAGDVEGAYYLRRRAPYIADQTMRIRSRRRRDMTVARRALPGSTSAASQLILGAAEPRPARRGAARDARAAGPARPTRDALGRGRAGHRADRGAVREPSPYVLRGEDDGVRHLPRRACAWPARRSPRPALLRPDDRRRHAVLADRAAAPRLGGEHGRCRPAPTGATTTSARSAASADAGSRPHDRRRRRPSSSPRSRVAASELDGAVDATLTTGSTATARRGRAVRRALRRRPSRRPPGCPVQVQFEPPADLDVIDRGRRHGHRLGRHPHRDVRPRGARPGGARQGPHWGIEAYFARLGAGGRGVRRRARCRPTSSSAWARTRS